MKIALTVTFLYLLTQTNGQIIHRADSLYVNYFKKLKKQKPISHLVVSSGVFDNENIDYLSKYDSLYIISLAAFTDKYELAIFDDFNFPRITISDSNTVFEFIKNKQDSLLRGYWEERQKSKNLPVSQKLQTKVFEMILFNIRKPWYSKKQGFHYFLYDKISSKYGTNLQKAPWYQQVRFIIDSLNVITKNSKL